LGVSSPQLDEIARGFSFRGEAYLDMRMDTRQGMTAAEWLASAPLKQITAVLREYGDERFAYPIAQAIVARRATQPIETTRVLSQLVEDTVRTREKGQHPATRTFQAIRIHVNQELLELTKVLPQCVEVLSEQGRLVVMSFHSLEDRIVKRFIRDEVQPPQPPAGLPIRAVDLPRPRLRHVGKPVRASAAEVARNPRARSVIMRVAERRAA
jgi:16S rRNA (cytosine1402-N4)-methyltransferase